MAAVKGHCEFNGGDDSVARASIKLPKGSSASNVDSQNGSKNDTVVNSDMIAILYSEVKRKGIAGHHIESMNIFNSAGIGQIITKVFNVDITIKNMRETTPEDREIESIVVKIDFANIELKSPVIVSKETGESQALFPQTALQLKITYLNNVYANVKLTARANKRDGTHVTKEVSIDQYKLAAVPCMVGSDLCSTYRTPRESLHDLHEDPNSPGGYFIIKGAEWVIDNLENVTSNVFSMHRAIDKKEHIRGTFLSKPGDAFENSYQLVIRYFTSGSIDVELTVNKTDKIEIPFYMFFRALGMVTDRDIVDNIVYGIESRSQATIDMLKIIQEAYEVDDPKYASIRHSVDPTQILEFMSKQVNTRPQMQANLATSEEAATAQVIAQMMNMLDRYCLPHIGNDPSKRHMKLRFMGHLINKLLLAFLNIIDTTDRDSYKNKRLNAAGTSISKAFKTHFNLAVTQPLNRMIKKQFKDREFNSVDLAAIFKNAIRPDDLERLLSQAITVANQTKIKLRRMEVTSRISTQPIYYKNDMNVKSVLNTITTRSANAMQKQTERADEMRRVHSSYPGFVDISQSTDTGEKVGTVKQMACTASISHSSSSLSLKKIVSEELIGFETTSAADITRLQLTKVFVNGDWIGMCKNSHEFVRKYRTMRRKGEIHRTTSIVWELRVREVYFWTDVGRMLRPLVIVYNNYDEYCTASRAGKPIEFKQWTLLTKQHIRDIIAGKKTIADLTAAEIVEYITPDEQEDTFLAPNIETLRRDEHDITMQYTHCDIDQAIFGIVTLASAMSNHANSIRNTMYTNHRKQSAGWYALNWPYRYDKSATLQHYCDKQLITSFSDALTYPNGQNCIVALATASGYGQEDSLVLNRGSIDTGMFNASQFTIEKIDPEKKEEYATYPDEVTMAKKKDARYTNLDSKNFVKKNTYITKGQVLVSKVMKLPKQQLKYIYTDRSIVYKKDEEAYVVDVFKSINEETKNFSMIKLRTDRRPVIGDKLSSLTGNKGIISDIIPREDMIYSEDGIIPDIIVNPHSIPSRMAINQIMMTAMGIYSSIIGVPIDATPFKLIEVDDIVNRLEEHGIKYGGAKRMFNGRTGEWLDHHIFLGPTTYQRLEKFVIDEHYSMRKGPTVALTRQPLEGKTKDGGLRVGEMEKDVIVAHGTSRTLHEKFYADSDGFNLHVCRRCGNRATVNVKNNTYRCNTCGNNANIVIIPSSWVSNVFINEISAMNIKMKLDVAPFEILNKNNVHM